MARSTKSYEERLLQLEKREQESLEKAKQYAAQKRELKKRQKDVETKKRTHRLCQIGGAVESVLGSAIEEEDIPGSLTPQNPLRPVMVLFFCKFLIFPRPYCRIVL